MAEALPLRSELPIEETWDLSLLFATQEDFEQAYQQLKVLVKDFQETYQGKLAQKEVLVEALKTLEKIVVKQSHVFSYGLAYETDKLTEVNEINAKNLDVLGEYVGQYLAFMEPEISTLSEELVKEVATSSEGERFRYYLENILRSKKAVLSVEVETVLSSLQGSLYNQYELYGALKFQDLSFAAFEANGQVYSNSFVEFEGDYEGHADYEVRHQSWKSFHQGLARYQQTAATNYINLVQTEKKMATLRGFDSVFDYLLFDHRVTREAYDRQIDVIMSEFAPVMRRYARLLAKEQGLAEISLADIKMPFTKTPVEKISIEESRRLIEATFEVFGEEYMEIIRRSFDERWIDYPMNQTKSTGGFCSTVMDGPAYILLNWTGLLSEVLVLAHELGHAGHFELTYRYQSPITPDVSLYFVEAPSTANEVIMCQYLLNQPIDQSQKRVLITEFIARTYFHNMVTHLLEAAFQRKVYQAVDAGEFLNADRLNAYFRETLEAFWGDEVVINEGAELTWMRQPHYFMGLYPYTYSAGLTIGTAVGQKVAAKDEEAIQKWLDVLKAGGTMNPLELANHAGVSMENADALRSAIQYVDHLLDQVETLA